MQQYKKYISTKEQYLKYNITKLKFLKYNRTKINSTKNETVLKIARVLKVQQY